MNMMVAILKSACLSVDIQVNLLNERHFLFKCLFYSMIFDVRKTIKQLMW